MPLSPEHFLFAAYCLAGPATWFVYALGLRTGLRRLSLLDRIPAFPTDEETVLAIIPAHNEQPSLERCLASVFSQKACALHVLAISDRSTDNTPEIIAALQNAHSNLHAITLTTTPPQNQTGKCAALIQGLAAFHLTPQTSHLPPPKWLLFIDADTTLAPGAISAALRLALRGRDGDRKAGHDFVSLLPLQHCQTPAEKAVVPLFAAAIVALFAVPYANSDHLAKSRWTRSVAFACGQFILIRSDLYSDLGGHAKVAHLLAEDVELAYLAQKAGAQPRVALAPHYVSTTQRGNDGAPALIHQWARNFFGHPRPLLPRPLLLALALAFPYVTVLSLLPAALWTAFRLTALSSVSPLLRYAEGAGWLAAVSLHTIFLVTALRATYTAQHLPPQTIRLFPQGLLLYSRTLFKALTFCLTQKVPWRPPQ